MTVYVDEIINYGWRLGPSCHLFTDDIDLTELHEMARKIGLRRAWFQERGGDTPHYDLTESRRVKAIKCGAVEVDFLRAVSLWRHRRELVKMRGGMKR